MLTDNKGSQWDWTRKSKLRKIPKRCEVIGMEWNIHFTPETEDEKEEARRQRFANLTDRCPDLAILMNGKTWAEIYASPAAKLLQKTDLI